MNKAEELGYTRAALILYHKDKMQELVDYLKDNEKFTSLHKETNGQILFWGVSCTIPVLKTKGYEFSLEELLESAGREKGEEIDGRKKVTS